MSSLKRKLSEPNSVLKSLFELKVSGTLCDVQLHVGGTTLIAHACVLASSSSYFLELFKLNQEIHWCSRNPLVIDLETLSLDSKVMCVVCVSKLIDFMYLRKLVILQDHYEHFIKINRLFQVIDFLPLGENYKRIKLNKPENNSDKTEIVEINKNGTSDSFFKEAPSVSISSNSSLPIQLDSYANGIKVKTCEKTIRKVESKLGNAVDLGEEKTHENEKISRASDAKFSNENLESSLKKTCEFMCCNPEAEVNSNLAKLRKRRKMFCELCDFSSVSIKKVLQHIQSNEHFVSNCPICLRKMSNSQDLKDHLEDHVDSKPFICQICKKRNRYWDYHKMHMKIHCRNKSFYCDFCHRGFVSKRSLSEHLMTHKGSYLCENCDYYTPDLKIYRSHLLEHEIKVSNKSDLSSKFNFDSESHSIKQNTKRFKCQVCDEGFTQKKNLARHVKLKHFDATKFKCSMCSFVSDRIDLVSNHMKKKHGCTLLKEKKKSIIKNKLDKDKQNRSEFVGVLIPIQLVSDNSSLNSFAPDDTKKDLTCTNSVKYVSNESNTFLSTHAVIHENSSVDLGMYVESEVTINATVEHKAVNDFYGISSDTLQEDNILVKGSSDIENCEISQSEKLKNIQPDLISVSHSFNVNTESPNSSQPLNGSLISKVPENVNKEEVIFEGNRYIWLNETTGELLNYETFMNMQAQKTFCKGNQKISGGENSSLEFSEKLKNSLMNEASKECSTLDFIDENEEWQLPQTPQTSVVGFDDGDNIFSWNQIDSSFYSTWVLNEATGELNPVSFFSIQPVRSHTELGLGEKCKSTAPLEDDDTALFLNEGTGDLSVIYFKPNELEKDESCAQPCEKPTHDNLETLSEISDNDSDLLNEEFMRVSANFMSNEENEKFLNELTGEFDIANLDNYQTEVLNQVSGNETYLNEETGEISWNTMDNNENHDLFAKPDALEYDLDDSLNCEDFEPFFRDVSEFSSQFCLDKASENWKSAEEASDALVLNECTGELVKKN